MKNITNRFTEKFYPLKSLVMYQSKSESRECFVEAYDFSGEGKMINPHPLSLKESHRLGRLLAGSFEKDNHVFEPKGLLPANVLYTSSRAEGMAVWYTPAAKKNLLFRADLGIPSGEYSLPPLLWKAGKESLSIYALKSGRRPQAKSPLFKAPFFNIHHDGKVCMGTVDIDIEEDCYLETFMQQWESYFFNSYFSHLLGDISPVKGNIVQLYEHLSRSEESFPLTQLVPIQKNIQQVIHEK